MKLDGKQITRFLVMKVNKNEFFLSLTPLISCRFIIYKSMFS